MGPTIRRALPENADFIAWTILAAQRGHLSRGWFDIALNRDEAGCLAFVRRIALAHTQSWWHVSQFWIAEADGMPAAALCAVPAPGPVPLRERCSRRWQATSASMVPNYPRYSFGARIRAPAGSRAVTAIG
jgi:hypothetical protein